MAGNMSRPTCPSHPSSLLSQDKENNINTSILFLSSFIFIKEFWLTHTYTVADIGDV